MNRINDIFERCQAEKRRALVMYVCCGCPDMAASEALIGKEIESGADIVELGVPFSDPMADGAVIQAASQLALANGAKFADVLAMAARLRRKYPQAGLVLFSYYNVMLRYGVDKLAAELARIGVDAILPVDLPYEEREEIAPACRKHGIHIIPLVAPETPLERARKIVADATGFVYYVTVSGVTGERREFPPEVAARLEAIRTVSPAPVVAGFGIADGETARMLARHADGVVVGSAAVHPLISGEPFTAAERKITDLVASLAKSLKNID